MGTAEATDGAITADTVIITAGAAVTATIMGGGIIAITGEVTYRFFAEGARTAGLCYSQHRAVQRSVFHMERLDCHFFPIWRNIELMAGLSPAHQGVRTATRELHANRTLFFRGRQCLAGAVLFYGLVLLGGNGDIAGHRLA
jgi:hypothetical protein